MTIIDKAIRMTHLIPCSKIVTTKQAAQYYFGSAANLHDVPKFLYNTRGTQLTSKFGRNYGDYLGQDLGLVQHFIHKLKELWRG